MSGTLVFRLFQTCVNPQEQDDHCCGGEMEVESRDGIAVHFCGCPCHFASNEGAA